MKKIEFSFTLSVHTKEIVFRSAFIAQFFITGIVSVTLKDKKVRINTVHNI